MMARKQRAETIVNINFPRTGNAWLDAGTVGLYRLIRGTNEMRSFLGPGSERTAQPLTELPDYSGVDVELSANDLRVSGDIAKVESLLMVAYDRLIECYFNLSSAKQRADTKAHNFYYSTESHTFETFPKRKPAGAALLLFDKAARPTGKQIKWRDKKSVGTLPTKPEYADIQSRLDRFLSERGLKAGPPSGMLVDGQNEVRPKLLKIKLDGKNGNAVCYLTGDASPGLGEAKQTTYPLLGGSRAFVSGGNENVKISWTTDFVGKFAPAVCCFMQRNDALHLFFPVAGSLFQIDRVSTLLGGSGMVDADPNLYRNFDDQLGKFFDRSSEVAVAFLHRALGAMSNRGSHAQQILQQNQDATDDDDGESLGDEPEKATGGDSEPMFVNAVAEEVMRHGAISFAIVTASKKGNVWMPKAFWNYTDIVYVARLFEKMQSLQERTVKGKTLRYAACSPKKFFNSLVDFSTSKDKTLLRDKVCEAILQKRSVLAMVEKHAFRAFASNPGNPRIGPLEQFVKLYEPLRYEGSEMEEPYKKMVETATWLGTNIGKSVASAVNSDGGESPVRAKGAIHRLRKARTVADFVNELARLQFRYGIDVPKDTLDGSQLTPDTLAEFRGFCVLAALNRLVYASKPKSTESK